MHSICLNVIPNNAQLLFSNNEDNNHYYVLNAYLNKTWYSPYFIDEDIEFRYKPTYYLLYFSINKALQNFFIFIHGHKGPESLSKM